MIADTACERNVNYPMTEKVRKRISKWDVMAETHVPMEIRKETVLPPKAGDSCDSNVSNSPWNSSKCDNEQFSKWPGREANDVTLQKDSSEIYQDTKWSEVEDDNGRVSQNCSEWSQSPMYSDMEASNKDGSKRPYWEPISGNQTALHQTHRISVSPDVDTLRQHSHSISPKGGWSRSCRSRSRSPSRGFNRGCENWDGRGRVEVGSCRNFAAGRCMKGSQCRYLHEDGGRRHSDRYTDSREHRDYSRDKLPHRNGSHYDGDWVKHELLRNNRSSELCFDFTMGRCQRGSACRYIHHHASSDAGWLMRDEARERVHGKRDAEAAFGQRLEPRRINNIPCKYFAEGRCRRGESCKFSHQIPVANAPNSPQLMGADNFARNNFIDRELSMHRPQDPESLNHGDGIYQTLPQEAPQIALSSQEQNISQEANVQQHPGMNLSTSNLPTLAPIPGRIFNQTGQGQFIVPQPLNARSFVPNIQTQQVVHPPSFNGQSQQQIFYSLPPNGQSQFVAHQALPNIQQNFNFSGQNQQTPPSTFNWQSQQIINSFAPNVQDQYMAPQPTSNPQSFNPDHQSHQTISHPHSNSYNHTQIGGVEPTPRADTSELKTAQISSDTITQKVVTSEQVAQISNLTASLAQIFGNGQGLPQLYATLNPQNVTGLAPSQPLPDPSSVKPLAPAAAQFIQPNHGSWPQQQHDLPPGFSSISVEQKDDLLEESQNNLKSLPPVSVIDGPSNGNSNKSVDLEEKMHLENHKPKEVELSGDSESKEANGTETGQSKQEPVTAHSEDVDGDVRTDGESKRSKDTKGMRLFKYALVEFVKDVLKPTWKEGYMSKEAHKTIVKKVVEKVTGAMQGTDIPQTQEKIDIYLTYSQIKLNKLVQAYVEKYVKS